MALAFAGELSPAYRRVEEIAQGIREGAGSAAGAGVFPCGGAGTGYGQGPGTGHGGAVPFCAWTAWRCTTETTSTSAPQWAGGMLPVVVKTLAFQKL